MRFQPPKIDFSREEVAEREIGRTAAGAGVRRFLIAAFLLTVAGVPVAQYLTESGRIPRAFEIFRAFPNAWRAAVQAEGISGRVSAANASLKADFKAFEKSLESESFIFRRALPPVQRFTSRFLGLGNEKVYLGRDGWLFFRPDVDHVLGPGFLDSGPDGRRQGGPVPALLRFHDDLAVRGIRLVVVPVPVKPQIEPEHLSSRHAPAPLRNRSFKRFVRELENAGIECLDISDALVADKVRCPQFLKTDTHWTPTAMERAAGLIAEKIRSVPPASLAGGHAARAPLSGTRPTDSAAGFSRAPATEVVHAGDLTAMLRVGPELFPSESVRVRPVLDAEGKPWRANPAAEVLLLGDSFANIYSAHDLGWGTGAGLAEQLSCELQEPVDRIAINAGGASTARQSLARSPARLAGKRVVVCEFAARELSSGDWKILQLAPPATTTSGISGVQPALEKQCGQDAIAPGKSPAADVRPELASATGTIHEITHAPPPGSLPYKDLLICAHVTDVSGLHEREILLFLSGMTNGTLTPANALRAGDNISFRAVPWTTAEEKLGSINRLEISGPAADIEDIYWTEAVAH